MYHHSLVFILHTPPPPPPLDFQWTHWEMASIRFLPYGYSALGSSDLEMKHLNIIFQYSFCIPYTQLPLPRLTSTVSIGRRLQLGSCPTELWAHLI